MATALVAKFKRTGPSLVMTYTPRGTTCIRHQTVCRGPGQNSPLQGTSGWGTLKRDRIPTEGLSTPGLPHTGTGCPRTVRLNILVTLTAHRRWRQGPTLSLTSGTRHTVRLNTLVTLTRIRWRQDPTVSPTSGGRHTLRLKVMVTLTRIRWHQDPTVCPTIGGSRRTKEIRDVGQPTHFNTPGSS